MLFGHAKAESMATAIHERTLISDKMRDLSLSVCHELSVI